MSRNVMRVLFAILLFFSCRIAFADQEITVCGTGDSQELLRALAQSFEGKNPGMTVHVPDSIGSGGGVKATANGKCDLGRVARPIKKKEEKYNLQYRVFGISPVVFVVNKSVQNIDTITTDQINGIYAGRITLWKELGGRDTKIYVVNREEGDSSRSVLEENLAGFKDIGSFAGKIIYSTPETVETLLKYEDTIGYTALGTVVGTDLKILHVDGVAPSADNINKGRYTLVSPFGIVWKDELKGLSLKFFEFLFTPSSQKIIKDYGVVPKDNPA